MSGKTLGEGKQKVSLPSAKTLFGAEAANLKSVDAQVGTKIDIPNASTLSYARQDNLALAHDQITCMHICYITCVVGEISTPSIEESAGKEEICVAISVILS